MSIRAATVSDVDILIGLHAKGFVKGWGQSDILGFIQRDLVLVTGDPIVGFIIIRQVLDEAEVITVVIDPLSRKKRQGLTLLNHALDLLAQSGTTQIFLEVAIDNSAAVGLYKKVGFHQVGLRKAYYGRATGPACDALVMSKELP